MGVISIHLIGARRRCRLLLRAQVAGAVLQQGDLDPAATRAVCLAAFGRSRDGSVPHADGVDPVHGDLMLDDQVAHHRLRHLLRVLDGCWPLPGEKPCTSMMYPFWSLSGVAISSSASLALRLRAICPDLKWISAWVEGWYWSMFSTTCSTAVEPDGGLLRRLVGELSAVAGIDGVHIRLVGLERRYADSFRGAGIHVSDGLGVLGRDLIQLVEAAAHRVQLLLDVLLAGERVQVSPEAFMPLVGQRLMAVGGGLRVLSVLGAARSSGSGSSEGSAGIAGRRLLRPPGHSQSCSQRQRQQDLACHDQIPPKYLGEHRS